MFAIFSCIECHVRWEASATPSHYSQAIGNVIQPVREGPTREHRRGRRITTRHPLRPAVREPAPHVEHGDKSTRSTAFHRAAAIGFNNPLPVSDPPTSAPTSEGSSLRNILWLRTELPLLHASRNSTRPLRTGASLSSRKGEGERSHVTSGGLRIQGRPEAEEDGQARRSP